VVQIGTSTDEVLGTSRQYERLGQGAGRSDCRRDSLDGEVEGIDRIVEVSGRVLNGAAGQPDARRLLDDVGAGLRLSGEAVLEIGAHRQRGGLDDGARVRQSLLTGDRAFTVGTAQRKRQAAAGRGQGFEAETGQELGGARIPGVGDDKGARPLVERPERRSLAGPGHRQQCLQGGKSRE
jgi:hypothetical protein